MSQTYTTQSGETRPAPAHRLPIIHPTRGTINAHPHMVPEFHRASRTCYKPAALMPRNWFKELGSAGEVAYCLTSIAGQFLEFTRDTDSLVIRMRNDAPALALLEPVGDYRTNYG